MLSEIENPGSGVPAASIAAAAGSQDPQNSQRLEISASRHLISWLAEENLSLAFSTYQTGKLFMIGTQDRERISVFERTFTRAMGLYASADEVYLSTVYQIWRFSNILQDGQQTNGYDRYYVPRESWVTGDLDVHDLAVDRDGRLVFVNTLFGCLATTAPDHSFHALWKPNFLSGMNPEDRCHLNGLAMRDGLPRYVTAVSTSDVLDGWRDRRQDSGVVIDIATDEIIARGFSMPHSPRWYRDRLWLLNSGAGHFGYLDGDSGEFVSVCFCPGYARGLAFYGDYALIGLSLPRHNKTFTSLPLDEELSSRDADPRCGLLIVDIRSGSIVHWIRMEGIVTELYDVSFLPGVKRPMMMGFKNDDIKRILSYEGPPQGPFVPSQEPAQ